MLHLRRTLALFLALGSMPALATSFYEKPFPDAVRESGAIVRGKVLKSEVQWATLPDGVKRLFTFYDVEVTEGFKGKPKGGMIRIREIGGEKDGVGLQVSGAAQFTTGEEVVVLLGSEVSGAENVYPISGMAMGKYGIEKTADGKEVLRGSGLGSSTHPALRKDEAPGAGNQQVTLEGLREMVRAQAAEPAKPKESSAAVAVRSGEKSVTDPVREETQESLMPSGKEAAEKESTPLRGIYAVIGLAIGSFWFLKSRRKRR